MLVRFSFECPSSEYLSFECLSFDLNGAIAAPGPSDDPLDESFDIEAGEDGELDVERLAECGYWRCGELFETRTANHVFCRKACRSRQRKWERSVERKANREANKKAAREARAARRNAR